MAAAPIRILYVHHRPELGGAPSSLYHLLRALDRERFDPHVYCPEGPSADLFRAADATVHVGAVAAFTHIWASTYSGRRWLLLGRELAHLPRHATHFRRTLKEGCFDLVHLNDSPLIPAAWLAHRAGVPVVWHLRSSLGLEGRGRRSQLIRAALRRFGAASIAINRNIADVFDVGSEVIPNIVDLDHFRPTPVGPSREALDLPPDVPMVAFFGYIYPSKGFRDFIFAASLLRARGLKANYLIVGGGVRGDEFFDTYFGRTLRMLGLARNYADDAQRLVQDLRLGDCVRFVPYTRDTARIYGASDVVVAPSRGPELGRPVLEAAACGRPVVASGSRDGGGIVLPEETGLLVPRRSPQVLAAALETLLRDDELRGRLGENARRHAEVAFGARANTERVMEVYDRLLGRA